MRRCVLLFLWLTITVCKAQTHAIQDFGVWTGISAKTKLSKNFKGAMKIQQRMKENASQFASTFIQVGSSYKINNRFKAYLNLRHTFGYTRHTNRIDLRVGHRKKIIKRTWLNTTVKNQYNKNSNSDSWKNNFRFKWEIEHKIKKKKLYPYFSNEWFYDIGNYLSGYRINLGLTFDLPNKQGFTIVYTRDQELNESYPTTGNIIGAFYSVTL